MRRPVLLLGVLFALMLAAAGLFTLLSTSGSANAQDVTTQGHPMVGTWLANTDGEGSPETDLFIFSSDGTYTQLNPDGSQEYGAWQATGANTGILTIVGFDTDEDGAIVAMYTIRASAEVAADGNTFSGEWTLQYTFADGTSPGEAGPAPVTATRLAVEAPGTPVMTMDELFSQFDDEASPEASPAA